MRSLVEVEDEVLGVGIEQGGVVARVQLGDRGRELEQEEAGQRGAGSERERRTGEEAL
jgi:hypothetical protein